MATEFQTDAMRLVDIRVASMREVVAHLAEVVKCIAERGTYFVMEVPVVPHEVPVPTVANANVNE